jgi:uncharacterized iron-regulated membrane protein
MKKNRNYYIRKTHRYLGVTIGIQFLLWTIGGLYFSWNNIDNVHGDHLRKSVAFLQSDLQVASPTLAIQSLRSEKAVDSIHSIHLIRVLDKPVYQIQYFKGHSGEGSHHHVHFALADATTGALRSPLTKEEASAIALEQIVENAKIVNVEYLEQVGKHSEYRERPLPAYAITFDEPACTIYIAAETGTYQTIRHNQWRAFDFLWMLHTMDYEGRDNFGNLALRAFSIFGLFTVCSGFLLFFVSAPWFNKRKQVQPSTSNSF